MHKASVDVERVVEAQSGLREKERGEKVLSRNSRPVWYMYLNNNFQFLNNIIHIFIHFFTYKYLKKIQITLLEQYYQTDSQI